MATDLSLIVDNTQFVLSGNISRAESPWSSDSSHFLSEEMYKGTAWITPRYPASFIFRFTGTSVAFIGVSPSSASERSNVTVDGTVYSVDYDDPSWNTYRKWFQSQNLVDGFHVVQGNCSAGTVLDFAIITAGTLTSLGPESTIFVDDDSPYISYSGNWSRDTSLFNINSYGGYAYGNSTHRSSTPGDTFTFRFSGTAVSVYGIFSRGNIGTFSATFSIDGTTVPQFRNITDIPYEREIPNYLHYSLGNLRAGDHTLIVNVTVADNHTFVLDYITYTPSFDSVLSMPVFSNTTTTKPVSIKSSTSSSQPSQVQTPGITQPSIRTTAILSGLIGVLALALVATVGMWVFLRWRKTKEAEDTFLNEGSENANNPHIPNPNGEQQQQTRQLQPVKYRNLNPADPNSPPNMPGATDLPYDPLETKRRPAHAI